MRAAAPAPGGDAPSQDEQGRVYGHRVAPAPPIAPDQVLDVPALVRHHLAKAQGFWAGMTGMDVVGEVGEVPTFERTNYMAIGLREVELALLLAELEDGTPLDVALTLVATWLEDGGGAGQRLHTQAAVRGIYPPGIRPYPTREALDRQRSREKHPHHVAPTLDADGDSSISWAVLCDAQPSAWCRQRPDDERCDCEGYTLQRDGAGDWFHEYVTEDDDGKEVTEHHRMKGGADCHVAKYLLVNGPHHVPDMFEGDDGTPARAGRIDLTWQGDYWTWDYAEAQAS